MEIETQKFIFQRATIGILIVVSSFFLGCQSEENSDPQALSARAESPFEQKVPLKWPEDKLNKGLKLHPAQGFLDDMPSEYNDGENPHIIAQLKEKWETTVSDKTFFQTDTSAISNKNYGSQRFP